MHHPAVAARNLSPPPTRVLNLDGIAPLVERARVSTVRIHRVQQPRVRLEARASDTADSRPSTGALHQPITSQAFGQQEHHISIPRRTPLPMSSSLRRPSASGRCFQLDPESGSA